MHVDDAHTTHRFSTTVRSGQRFKEVVEAELGGTAPDSPALGDSPCLELVIGAAVTLAVF